MSTPQHEQNHTACYQESTDCATTRDPVPSVLFVTNQFLPRVGGAEVLTLREAVALRALGHHVRIVTLWLDRTWPEHEEREGVPVLRTGGLFMGTKLRLRLGAQWLAEIRLAYELLRHRSSYDIVHMRQVSFLARPIVLASILTRKPVLVQIANAGPGRHAPIPAGAKTTLYAGTLDPHAAYLEIPAGSWGASDIETLRRSQWLAGLTLRLLRYRTITFLSVSERTTTHLIENGLRADQIVLLPTGIETENYAEAFRHIESRSQSASTEPRIVVCVARYRYEKGLDVLLHAWSHVRAQGINARLVLVGGGHLEGQLAAMIADLGLQESVQLAGLHNDVHSLLAQSDMFVLPSRYEGLPNALLEAMAAGLPCVATRVSGSEDVIEDGVSGVLVPPGEPGPLAAALVRLLAQPEEARVLGRAARERVVRYYERRDLMAQLTQLYRRLTGRTRAHDVSSARDSRPERAAALATRQTQQVK